MLCSRKMLPNSSSKHDQHDDLTQSIRRVLQHMIVRILMQYSVLCRLHTLEKSLQGRRFPGLFSASNGLSSPQLLSACSKVRWDLSSLNCFCSFTYLDSIMVHNSACRTLEELPGYNLMDTTRPRSESQQSFHFVLKPATLTPRCKAGTMWRQPWPQVWQSNYI